MIWVTCERPKIDRIACPCLIYRFINADAQIVFVPADEVLAQATPFDVPNVKFLNYGTNCSIISSKCTFTQTRSATNGTIVRGDDTDNHMLAKQATRAMGYFVGAGL